MAPASALRQSSTVSGSSKSIAECAPPKPYQVSVSFRFIFLTLLSSALLAFTVGRAVRVLLLEGPRGALLWPHLESSMRHRPDYHLGVNWAKNRKGLPLPQMMDGKEVPHTVYTSKNFDTAASKTSSSVLIEKARDAGRKEQEEGSCAVEGSCSRGKEPAVAEDEDEEHLPAGQHLLVDMKDIDGDFLNSEERLAQAMVEVVADSKLTLLSYHCHTLVPTGVSCVGVLLESHISFHTWPTEGVITLDLFTCGSAPLLPVLPLIQRLFGLPRQPLYQGEAVPQPGMLWSHKLRGFRPESSHGDTDALSSTDLGEDILGNTAYEIKQEVASVQTNFQRIDIYNVLNPKQISFADYQRSLSNDGSYPSKHPELFQPNKIVFLDGVKQSTLYGDAGYHESLVHPGMFAHPHPTRVAIIGGGEGATLREVLKHDTVEKCTMVEIDELMVTTSHQYLKEWSDCSDIQGSAEWCVNDPRADVRYEDAVAWFIARFSDGVEEKEREFPEEDYKKFDVIIMDALDPQVNIPFAEVLYKQPTFLQSVYNSLTDDGIIIMQLGDAPTIHDPSDQIGRNENRAIITKHLHRMGFESIHVYEEHHSGFGDPWSYLVAMKDISSRANWYKNVAQVEVSIRHRMKQTFSGDKILRFFDGATMMTYQNPHKSFETVYCRNTPTPERCEEAAFGFKKSRVNAPVSSFEVRTSEVGDHAGRGVFAKVDIPKGAHIGAEQSMHSITVSPATHETMDTLAHEYEGTEDLDDVLEYVWGYGFETMLYGEPSYVVDSTILTFTNHGCNGTHNAASLDFTFTEADLETDKFDPEDPFDMVVARHLPHEYNSGDFALRDIKAGEELLNNYLEFTESKEEFQKDVEDLRNQCAGVGVGSITEFEEGKSRMGSRRRKMLEEGED